MCQHEIDGVARADRLRGQVERELEAEARRAAAVGGTFGDLAQSDRALGFAEGALTHSEVGSPSAVRSAR